MLAVTSVAVRGGRAGERGRADRSLRGQGRDWGSLRGVAGGETARSRRGVGERDERLSRRRRRFGGRSGPLPWPPRTLAGVTERLRGIALSADSRQRRRAGRATGERPKATTVTRQGTQAPVVAEGPGRSHGEGRSQREADSPRRSRCPRRG